MHGAATSSKATSVRNKLRSYEQGGMPPCISPETYKGPEGRVGTLRFPTGPCISPPARTRCFSTNCWAAGHSPHRGPVAQVRERARPGAAGKREDARLRCRSRQTRGCTASLPSRKVEEQELRLLASLQHELGRVGCIE